MPLFIIMSWTANAAGISINDIPNKEFATPIIRFKNLDFTVRLPEHSLSIILPPFNDKKAFCKRYVGLFEKYYGLGQDEAELESKCHRANHGAHFTGRTLEGDKVGYLLYQRNPANAEDGIQDHELYHALRRLGTKEQITRFNQYISTISHGTILLTKYDEETAAQMVGMLSILGSGVKVSNISLHNEAGYIHKVLDLAKDDKLDFLRGKTMAVNASMTKLVNSFPKIYRVYYDLVSTKQCRPKKPLKLFRNQNFVLTQLLPMTNLDLRNYVRALSKNDDFCRYVEKNNQIA